MDVDAKVQVAAGILVACLVGLISYAAGIAPAVALLIGVLLSGVWLLRLTHPWRKWNARRSEGHGSVTVQAPLVAGVASVLAPSVKIDVSRRWKASASEPSGIWDGLPGMKGVLLSLRDRDGEAISGRLLCEVKLNGSTLGSSELAASDTGREIITRVYPGDFNGAPSLPLHDGDYEVTWFRATNDGVSWKELRTIVVRRRGGNVAAVLDESGGPA
jgi:hypothetical protein